MADLMMTEDEILNSYAHTARNDCTGPLKVHAVPACAPVGTFR